MALFSLLLQILKKPTIWDMLFELMMLTVPLWIAVIVGVVLGWAWRPKWAVFVQSHSSKHSSSSFSFDSFCGFNSFKSLIPSFFYGTTCKVSESSKDCNFSEGLGVFKSDSSLSKHGENLPPVVNEADLRHLYQLVEEQDGGPAWIHMMDRSTPTMTYQAWRRDAPTGPPQYCSRTIFEDATPEMVRDFFWDDEFRSKWDDMLIHHSTLEECKSNGTMIVHWVRKFPFFCSDREYVIGRRIWESGGSYYCVTKGVPNTSLPRRDKPRRVDLYYSSWCIRPVESPKKAGQLTSCEVLLFHHEDMGIPWEIAKLGVRQGMWGAVKKIDPGLRAYQKERSFEPPLSQSALMAHTFTRVSVDYLKALETSTSDYLAIQNQDVDSNSKGKAGVTLPKALIVGGAIALACTLDGGLVTKALIFGVARRFARPGRKL